jgi:choline kinase
MRVIILAAGIGSRLGELTKELPKPLVDVNGKSILERQISLYRKFGISDIILVIGHRSEKFPFKDVSYINGKKSFEHDILYSLMLARTQMLDDVIISYGDIIFDEKIIAAVLKFKGNMGLAVDLDWEEYYKGKPKRLVDKISNVIIENDTIVRIGYRKNIRNTNQKLVGEFIGLMKLSKNAANVFIETYSQLEKSHRGKFHDSPSLRQGIITDMLQELIEKKYIINPIVVNGKWCEIDTLDDLKRAKELFN